MAELVAGAGVRVDDTTTPETIKVSSIILEGSAAPEGNVTAPPGFFYSRSSGEVYRKATGTGNTGWQLLAGIVALSQTAYDALGTKDAATLYLITS